jgi:drug/metabolite transporter (DMT)-like permease
LLTAAVLWPAGSLLVQRSRLECSAVVLSAYQQLFGGLGLTAAMFLTAEPPPQPSGSAWVGWAYLVIAGSIISFTSYLVAVRNLPIRVVMTYAYVNPVIAVLLGWFVLQEPITVTTLLGMALILAGVAGVFRQRRERRKL